MLRDVYWRQYPIDLLTDEKMMAIECKMPAGLEYAPYMFYITALKLANNDGVFNLDDAEIIAVLGIPCLYSCWASRPRPLGGAFLPVEAWEERGSSFSTYRSRIQPPLGPRSWTAGRWRRNVGGLPPREHPVLKQAEEEAEV